MNILLGVILIAALLIVVNRAMHSGISVMRGVVPAYGPARQLVIAGIARRAAADLDHDFEKFMRRR